MAGAYSQDFSDRMIDAVVGEGISRRAAAARLGVGESSAVKRLRRFERDGLERRARGRVRLGVQPPHVAGDVGGPHRCVDIL